MVGTSLIGVIAEPRIVGGLAAKNPGPWESPIRIKQTSIRARAREENQTGRGTPSSFGVGSETATAT